MENEPPSATSRRGRLMGKLFALKEKDRKPTAEETGNNINDFLNGPSDTLQVNHASPSTAIPQLSKLDISSATRYPQALSVASHSQQSLNPPNQYSARSPGLSPGIPPRSPRRSNRKGLTVRFVDQKPDIIGEGGDESEIPAIEVSRRKKQRPPPSPRRTPVAAVHDSPPRAPSAPKEDSDFMPGRLRRTQTGFSSVSNEPIEPKEPPPAYREVAPGNAVSAPFLDTPTIAKNENRKSFIEHQQAEMRQAEGKAFAEAARQAEREEHGGQTPLVPQINESPTRSPVPPSKVPLQPRSPDDYRKPPEQSPSSIYSSSTEFSQQQNTAANFSRQPSVNSQYHMAPPSATVASRQASFNLHDAVLAVGDDALNTFVTRTRHFNELFRLHAETIKPISACSPLELSRAALWWLIKGRTALEVAVRARPGSPQDQMQNENDRQQAYANLAKGYWLVEEAIPEVQENKRLAPDAGITEIRSTLVGALKKLAVSMKRNGFLPPEEAFLPQTIDKSIWIEYPRLSVDMIALLTADSSAAMTGVVRTPSAFEILETLPPNDTAENFTFGRVSTDVFLMEQGMDSQRFYFPCLLTMVRPNKQHNLVFVIASQHGEVNLRIQGNKNSGPTWDDVRWRNSTHSLEIKLPRGFMIVVQCSQQDYRMLWNMYDFGAQVQSTLYARSDEHCVFRSTLRSFQYFDSNPNSRAFPKEAVANCDVALFEKIHKEHAAAGPRAYHRGYRIVVVTGPRTRTLSGVNHTYTPQMPIPFSFLRSDGGDAALMLKYDNVNPDPNKRIKVSMVLSFADEGERAQLNSLISGTSVQKDETIYADVPLIGFSMSTSLQDSKYLPGVSQIPWTSLRVINEDADDEYPRTVLADRLRVIVESKQGLLTDRVNLQPGELRVRLEVQETKSLVVMRQPQFDMTANVADGTVGKEIPKAMTEMLQMLQTTQTIRTYSFPTQKDLHAFQAALTGFQVVFDGLAATFAISRRRMVVPIHKKWEAGLTRVQVVQQGTIMQLLAFFPDFHHGQCMNFVLKGTDVYETFSRSSKAGIKFVDAKFPMPRMPNGSDGPSDDMGFICLDLPDLPGEHDDITLLFENEAGKTRPADAVSTGHRQGFQVTERPIDEAHSK
ncbi:hypothetical protein CABS01_04436 [Colletotrichum abscissum]|uniref:uncharacterized protein n=1 Tax=Colletotrichum abscissum TaxID=1671311 RepID=UPI0027D54AB6|nr:uncharacterized protein CABS01_04436 [Colletotrichum abscissum]KAK1473774.1 hypothetical protein CABS01_04436 [Colletotrichum abscissum]